MYKKYGYYLNQINGGRVSALYFKEVTMGTLVLGIDGTAIVSNIYLYSLMIRNN